MKIYSPMLLVAFTFTSLMVNAQTGGCRDPRAQVCNPGQYANTSGNQTACLACTGNTVANGCTRSCSACAPGTVANSAHTMCAPYPAGTYKDSAKPIPFGGGCEPTGMDDGTLHATCPNYFGVKGDSSLANADQCVADKHDIENIDGHLRCVLSSTKSRNGHGDVFDIISKSESVDSSGDTTTRWRIDHPNVSQGSTLYSQIVFQQGDNIKADAGGCVHTNGGLVGQRWKQYVNPSVDFQQRVTDTSGNANGAFWSAVFAGGLQIGAVGGKVQLASFVGMGEPFFIALPPGGLTIPGSGSSTYPKQFVLTLLYYDNEFNDNGYYSHDDGTNGQCANDGPAWVEITVMHPKKPIAYSKFVKGKNFDLTWRTDKTGIDDNGLPLDPLWSFQVENPGQVPDFQGSCIVTKPIVGSGPLPPNLQVLSLDSEHCTSQNPIKDPYTSSLGESVGICNTSDTVYGGHINWQVVTYQGALFYRPWSGPPPQDDDINLGLETDDQSGQTSQFEGPDTGIGLEFKNSETTANYTTPFWKAFHDNATSPDQLISVNGNNPIEFANGEYGAVTGLMGIDGVHKGYSELHPVFAIAIEVAWNFSDDGGADETWAFFVRNQGNEGTCSSHTYYWESNIGDWTYAIQLPWPDGATSVKVLMTPDSQMEMSAPGQQYLGIEGTKPWTYLRFRLPAYTPTGIDGEITLHYDGAAIKNARKISLPRRASTAKSDAEPSGEGELGVDWAALSARIADPAVRKKFLSELTEAFRVNTSTHAKGSTVAVDPKVTTFTHSQNIGVWTGKPGAVVSLPDTEKQKMAAAVNAVLARYSKELNLRRASPTE
jgi:hypothetical protein